jgi:predicted amidohydrolase YtcJ
MKQLAIVPFYLLILVTGTLLCLGWTGCSKTKIDLLLYNGKIYTVDKQFSVKEAVAIKNGRIVATGTSDELLDTYAALSKLDLKGRAVYPGFIDAHCHFYGYSTDLLKCDLTGTSSFEEVMDSVVVFAKRNHFSWLLGRGWDQNDWSVKEFPDNTLLDRLFPEQPVLLTRIDGHAALCNTAALRLARITERTRVDGGEIQLKDGKPTGILIDNAVSLVERFDSIRTAKGGAKLFHGRTYHGG